jgi:hypothetical protein
MFTLVQKPYNGCTTTQAVSHQLLTMEALAQFHYSPYTIYGG